MRTGHVSRLEFVDCYSDRTFPERHWEEGEEKLLNS